jgi:hypothetical protein
MIMILPSTTDNDSSRQSAVGSHSMEGAVLEGVIGFSTQDPNSMTETSQSKWQENQIAISEYQIQLKKYWL